MGRRTVVVKESGAAVMMVMFLAGGAAAQDTQSETQEAPAQQSSAVAAPVRSQDAVAQAEAMRGQMLTYGAVLQTAVQRGAEAVTQKARKFNAEAEVRLSGPTDVLFFRLDDVGPIFMIRVPGLRPNLPFIMTTLNWQQQQRRPVRAASTGNVEPTVLVGSSPASASAAAPPPPPAPFLDDLGVLSDTEAAYTREVKNAIIVAMLDNSQPLRIGNNEWLTIVAHDSAPADPRVPTSQSDFSTIKFQIRGSDLADYWTMRISTEEAKKRVKITEE
jgi:hypothetical protein